MNLPPSFISICVSSFTLDTEALQDKDSAFALLSYLLHIPSPNTYTSVPCTQYVPSAHT